MGRRCASFSARQSFAGRHDLGEGANGPRTRNGLSRRSQSRSILWTDDIWRRDGTKAALKDIPEFQSLRSDEDDIFSMPVRTSIRVNLQKRIRELEETLMEERRAREMAEHLVGKLEAKLAEITRTVSSR
jgi:hypothetical protein